MYVRTLEQRREEYRRNATAYIRRSKEYRKTPQGKLIERNHFLKHKYGLTLVQWNTMFAKQKGLCAICLTIPIKHTDHCHKTKIVRGLLCHGCNLGLGGFRDNIEFLQSALNYLTKVKEKLTCQEK